METSSLIYASNLMHRFGLGCVEVIMMDNKTVLISLIGKGRMGKEEKGYEKTEYYFEEVDEVIDTSFFGTALHKILLNHSHVDKWLIFGTNRSCWSELFYAVDERYRDEIEELHNKVYHEENKGISEELLQNWQDTLEKYIPGIRLIMVDPRNYKIYIDHMIKEIPDDKRNLVVDITHAFRHMPVIIAFSIMMLKHIKNISDIMVYYGAYELKGDEEYTPVLKIDFINTLVSYAESLATYNYSGYFPPLLELLGIHNTDKTYFKLEMNRQPRSSLEEINKSLNEISLKDDYQSVVADYIKKDFSPLVGATLDRRMVERGKFFFDKKQYLKALILLYEGIIIAIGRKYKSVTAINRDMREDVRSFIKRSQHIIFSSDFERDTYFKLEYTRNAAAHGSEAEGKGKGIKECVQEEEHFKELFKRGIELYESIVKESEFALNI